MNKTSYQVLVCDDSMLIRKKLRQLLEGMDGIEVLEAVNGREAVEVCRDKCPSVVFLDIVMPEQDGIEALIEIKQMNPSIIVIMASSVGTEGNLRKAIKAGADDFIQKPILPENVELLLAKYIYGKEEQNV
ncbi:response regulator transcription factor [Paenibacillus radicis (ex Xue et al. 2023)]|uniref:Response regulator n=1 Tax=Paenibacillus radicis (ex Xue et al. 2023) TaxID=2972489 RepID=A0ABT1YCU9_9BACL|nr:response regulator [Paenibacillus radicis (ex Xue et al. 2023)]MCR8630043.1 response regulator [Paenibacillus radicis (ex Xue et al. 2023)]